MTTWRDHRIFNLTRGEFVWIFNLGLVALVYELLVVFKVIEGDVLTRAYRANTSRWMIWPSGMGVLMGHLHGPTIAGVGTGVGGRWGIVFLVALGLAVLYRDLVIQTRYPAWWAGVIFLVCFFLGAAFWMGRP